jgi:FkbM family methyltransferase
MHTIFIDAGANQGDIAAWWAEGIVSRGEAGSVLAIEANPELMTSLRVRLEALREERLCIEVVHAAAWTHAQGIELFLSDARMDPQRVGATVCEGKTTNRVDYARGVRVPSVDMAALLTQLACDVGLHDASGETQLVLKLDIEGAEYAVLERLAARGVLPLLSGLVVETHHHKVSSIGQARHERVLELLHAWAGEPVAEHTTWRGYVGRGIARDDDRGLVGRLRAMLAADTRCVGIG